ncbi:MAG: aldehyde dehydrogenase family protein, partial [Bacteroidota bacterium]
FVFNLSFIPLAAAIAAGNTVILKPSEMTPHSSRVIKQIVNDLFPENEVAVVEGGVPETTHLLEQPFNHIFFTGSPAVGKIVMAAAAKNLTSVSLELGGKSPTIVDETANIDQAAGRIVWAKGMNNGQVCIAPDYVYVHESVKDQFVAAMKKHFQEAYGDNPQAESSYNRIVNRKHFDRLQGHLKDAVERGGTIELGGQVDAQDNYISPTIVSGLDDDALIWQEEIFGPLLPIRTFQDITDPISYINKGEKPLACYIYSRSEKNIQRVERETRSGGLVINYSTIHFINPNLPFGGSNNSGIGKGNGIHGFKAFSNAKAVQRFWSPVNALKMLWPPYNDSKLGLIKLVRKWLT